MSSSSNKFKRIVVVTGASKGIGKEIAIQANQKYTSDTLFILTARNLVQLEQNKNELKKKEYTGNKYKTLQIDYSNDKLNEDDYKKQLEENCLNNEDLSELNELIIFYNHGTLEFASVEDSVKNLHENYQVNLFSVWRFLTAIRKLFPIETVFKQLHVNISSLMATLCGPNWSLYATTRSARAALFKTLSNEQPKLRVLNYQPGPVYTDMLQSVNDFVGQTDKNFRDSYENNNFLSAETSVAKLFKILTDDKYESGCTIDYYDYK